MVRPWRPARLVPPLAAVKLTLGLAAVWATYGRFAERDPAFAYANYAVFPVLFGATGALLLLGGREDRRALALGGFFLAVATAWSDRPLHNLWQGDPSSYGLLALVDALEVSAFIPYFLWVFVREFPSPPPDRRLYQVMIRVSAGGGLALFAVNLLRYGLFQGGLLAAAKSLDVFTPEAHQEVFYTFVDLLTAAALLVLPWKVRQAQEPEKRRARLFQQLLALTLGPAFTFLVIYLVGPGAKDFFDARPRLLLWISSVCLAPGLMLPVAVPYAVLVHRVLDVRLIARRALQYVLARSAATALVAVPTVALAVYVAIQRRKSVAELFSGPRVPLLIATVLVGAAALRYRKPLLEAIDRRFFRDQYDARYILGLLVERIRSVRDSGSLAALVTREIDLALHLDRTALLALDPRSGLLVDPRDPRNRTRRLDFSSDLALSLSNASAPLEVDPKSAHSPLCKLPERDRRWLVDNGFRLLVPIAARDGSLLGILGLGEKKSGLPFLREDRQLLHAIASSAAWVLELEIEQSLASSQSSQGRLEVDDPTPRELPVPVAESAKECPKCGALHAVYTVLCGNCSKRLETSIVPYVLPGKLRFESRVGVGGMGVVYRGCDLALGRRVAIKTLRHVSPEDVLRLLREAQAAAAVSHPHLAPIYGMETWQGTPLLVMELLEGGTLAQRLLRETLSPREVVDLGVAMSGALGQLHDAKILHRDVKPSNIGYTRDHVPKLMDFGIARVGPDEDDDLLGGEEEEEGDDTARAPLSPWTTEDESRPTVPFRFAGTLSYLSPEAARGEPASPSFDLWGLAIVLYECLLGKKIFTGTQEQVLARIRAGVVPDFSQVLPDLDEVLGDFFRAALHRSPARRPASAEEMRRRLEEVRGRLDA